MLLVIYLLGDLVGQGGKRGSKCELELLNPIPLPLSSGLREVLRKILNLEVLTSSFFGPSCPLEL